jgi:hypothetical protein
MADTSKMTNLCAQVVKRLSPRNCSSLAVMATRGIRCRPVGEVIQLGTGDPQLPAAPLQLSARPQQHLCRARQGGLPLRSGAGQRPDPLLRIRIEPMRRQGPLGGRIS